VNEDAARRAHRGERVILDFGAVHLPADDGGEHLGLLAGHKPCDVEAVSAEV
jgi:hypothetical protein